MSRESKILPDGMSGALKSMSVRLFGAALMLLGVCLVFALIFHNPYLDGFAAASTFGDQSLFGQIVGFFRFYIGFKKITAIVRFCEHLRLFVFLLHI